MNEYIKARDVILSLAAVFSGSAALAETTVGADVTLTGGYTSNTYLTSEGSGSATVRASAVPHFSWTRPTSTFTLSGQLDHVRYLSNGDDRFDWSAGGDFTQQITPTSNFFANTRYSSRTQTTLTRLTLDPEDPDPTVAEDAGRRVKTIQGSAGFSTQLTGRDELSIVARGSRVERPDSADIATTFDVIGGTVSASHVLDGRTTLSAGVDYQRNSFDRPEIPSSSVITPSVSARVMLIDNVVLTAKAGVDFRTIDAETGSTSRASFSGRGSLCRKGPLTSICASASHAITANAYVGTSQQTSAGLTYSYSLTPLSSVNTSVSYSTTKSLDNFSGGSDSDYSYLQSFAAYQRKLTERLSGVARAQYTKSIESTTARGSNIYLSLGLTYRLGR